MNVAFKTYEPMGTQILLEMTKKSESEGGIKFAKAKIDQWMRLVKKGSVVPEVEIGDHVLLADPSQSIRLTFEGNEYLQTSVHNVIGRVPAGSKEAKEAAPKLELV